jgi:glyoxylase-like metal-dependent hydrolase (beta-lactamase superfamily II)
VSTVADGLIDIGLDETVEEIVELIRNIDFPLSKCKMLIATHADVDHIQGMAKAKHLLKAPVYAHPRAIVPLETGDKLRTFAQIEAQKIDMAMPPVKIDGTLEDGDKIQVGGLTLEVWLTPGHTDSQLSFRLGDILFSGDSSTVTAASARSTITAAHPSSSSRSNGSAPAT